MEQFDSYLTIEGWKKDFRETEKDSLKIYLSSKRGLTGLIKELFSKNNLARGLSLSIIPLGYSVHNPVITITGTLLYAIIDNTIRSKD